MTSTLEAPRLNDRGALRLAGIATHVGGANNPIPALWTRFMPLVSLIPNRQGDTVYGVMNNARGQGEMDYLAAVEVSSFDGLSEDLMRQELEPHTYAVFTHHGPVMRIRETWAAIWRDWIPESGREAADAPSFERYDERFDPATGTGEVEIWLPIKP